MWLERGTSKDSKPRYLETFKHSWKIIVFAIVLMAAFNFFSHGTQDMYPTFLKEQHGFGNGVESLLRSSTTSLRSSEGSLQERCRRSSADAGS